MPDRAKWEERVAAWKASGLGSPEFCKGRGFSASGLRYWASRLRREGSAPMVKAPQAIRLGRVLRRLGPAPEAAVGTPESVLASPLARAATPLLVECGGLRVVVLPGFDRGTLAAVLDVVAARAGQ